MIFARDNLKEREHITRLADRLESDLAAVSLQTLQADRGGQKALTIGQSLLTQPRTPEPVGRLVIIPTRFVVPLDADRIAPLTLWTRVTQIIYNLAIAVAAVNSFTNVATEKSKGVNGHARPS